ncbi:MAG: flagellar motor protein MotB [Betaproteobacteria bacterium]|nr:flagellar motor protein MotB [Betaproteobacteria bacterium]
MKDDKKPIIVIKRIKKGGHAHHGGAWKIAYADFVTAMMAFFLLMWLLGSTTKGDLQGIADHFNSPLKVALAGGSGSGDSSSVIKGGGQDLPRTHGQIARTEKPDTKRSINLQAAQAEVHKQEMSRLAELKVRMADAIEASASLRQFSRQIRLDITSEGLRIQIVDEQNRPMFDTGSARLKDYTREILREIARVLNGVDNRITLSGHTDSLAYSGGERGYSNWELSADRANASRRELIAGGINERKIMRVVGLADSLTLSGTEPNDPSNRRISIIVMSRKAEEAARGEGPTLEVNGAGELGGTLPAAGAAKSAPAAAAAAAAVAAAPAAPAAAQTPPVAQVAAGPR